MAGGGMKLRGGLTSGAYSRRRAASPDTNLHKSCSDATTHTCYIAASAAVPCRHAHGILEHHSPWHLLTGYLVLFMAIQLL